MFYSTTINYSKLNKALIAETMHIAYSALSNASNLTDKPKQPVASNQPDETTQALLTGYYAACDKYRHEIAAIQQYIPGWMPAQPLL